MCVRYGAQYNRTSLQISFSKALEENICKFISNEALIPLSDVPPEYDKLAIAFKECLEVYSSVVPVSLLKEVWKELRVETRRFESKLTSAHRRTLKDC